MVDYKLQMYQKCIQNHGFSEFSTIRRCNRRHPLNVPAFLKSNRIRLPIHRYNLRFH